MSLKAIKQINVDFHDSKYISINAKQYDRMSRFILVSCHNNGTVFPLDNIYHYAFIRYRKADDLGVFNKCDITDDGKILIELSEQMLAAVGRCYADLIIIENNYVTEYTPIIENTGELIINDNDSILSTMTFCINVIETAFDNTEIESSYEYNALNDLLIKATEDYTYIMSACKISERNAKTSEKNAEMSESNAKASEANAKASEINAKTSEENASLSESNAKASEENAAESETNAKACEENAKNYSDMVTTKAAEVLQSAAESAENAQISADKATESSDYATLSQSYAVGGTNTRINEDTDNAKYYYTQTKSISDSIDGMFSPQGTIEFAELSTVTKETGYVYHISDAFITDDTFKEGAGVSYPAGTNVYYTADGYWDCFVGENLIVVDDGEGNVEVICSYDFVTTYETSVEQTIAELRNRINALESQAVLGITE